jgi:hypothetical protein
MKHSRTPMTNATAFGAAMGCLMLVAAGATTFNCGWKAQDTNSYTDTDCSQCDTGGGCTVNYYDKATYCTAAANPAYCNTLDENGNSCTQAAWVSRYPGTCVQQANGGWTCQQIPGGTPTTGQGESPEPCSYGYDAEVCPEQG